jgi:hypothetical protein
MKLFAKTSLRAQKPEAHQDIRSSMNLSLITSSAVTIFDRFLFAPSNPAIVAAFRIGFAILVLINTCVLIPKAELWFSDRGLLKATTARTVNADHYWSLFTHCDVPQAMIVAGLWLMLVHAALMLLGCWSRLQAACLFFWLTCYGHRNTLITDGEDTVFRLFAFFMMFMPLDACYSLRHGAWLPSWLRLASTASAYLWGMRLVQIEVTLIYASAAISKLSGRTWRDGSAMYYVMQFQDHWGRTIGSQFLDSPTIIRALTWGGLGIECLLPFALWWPPSRRWAILFGIAFHLSIEATMHLFLFEWIMILGLISFLDQPSRQASATKTIIER